MTKSKVDGGVGIAWEGNDISSLRDPTTGQNRREVLTTRTKNAFVCSHLTIIHFERDVGCNFLEKHFEEVFAESSRLTARNR